MKNVIYIISIFLLPIFGCKDMTIPEGKYVSPDGEEYIIVKSSTIDFHVKIDTALPIKYFDKKLNYNVGNNGSMIPYTMTSFEYGRFNRFIWRWDGKNIVKKSKKDNTTVLFQIREDSTNPVDE